MGCGLVLLGARGAWAVGQGQRRMAYSVMVDSYGPELTFGGAKAASDGGTSRGLFRTFGRVFTTQTWSSSSLVPTGDRHGRRQEVEFPEPF